MLRAHLQAIQEAIRAGSFSTQASVSQGIILRILQVLEWPTFEINIVSPEYPINGRRVDFALCHPPGNPLMFIEVKPPGQAASGERQLFEKIINLACEVAKLRYGTDLVIALGD